MVLSIQFTDEGKTSLRELDITVQQKVKRALKAFAEKPQNGKPLREDLAGFSTLHVSEYRVIYRQTSTQIIVFFLGHRSTVYDRMIESLRRTAKD